MENTQFLTQIRARETLRHGTRAVLFLESSLPAGDTPMAQHVRALATALFEHAKGVYLPAAADELAALAAGGRGYDFTPHRLQFYVEARAERARVMLDLSLCYIAGQEPFVQRAKQVWSADGQYRLQ